jgi:chemotaxis response regulator CheB
MEKRRVLLVCSQHLFGESLEKVLSTAEDVELIGPWEPEGDVCGRIGQAHPNVVVVADENPQRDEITHLTTAIIERFPELSVIRVGLTEKVGRVFSTHLLPARGTDLLDTIRRLPAWEQMKSEEAKGS